MQASFEKLLTETDVNKKLSVPSAVLRHINGGQGGKAVEIVDDITGKTYQLMLQTRAGKYRKPVFQSKGWLKFVKDKGLQAGTPSTSGKTLWWETTAFSEFELCLIFGVLPRGDVRLIDAKAISKARTTSTLLEEALDQLGKFGVKLSMKDQEHLSLISPKAVSFANNTILERSHVDAPVVINCPTEHQDQVKYKRKSDTVCALKRWENSFKSDLWKAVEQLMFITRNEKVSSSLVGFLLSLKDHVTAASGNNGR
ncbi:hypothetical protein FNV43_RR20775 [Rhamnella rubrinervis]|uniref:TF-B3 domain-containing protein n=1 Tax=Rhamnella rubrinervis TaxID=2594499 RepID=A0A8K0E1T4_9ROSA|nr:hypothetical protein FNV43_RR20775 [Rhamnella rubrinervis]